MKKFVTNEVVANAQAVLQAATAYTESRKLRSTTGYAAALITTTAGSITVTFQCSPDNLNWYQPVDTAGTALDEVIAAMTVGSQYVVFAPQVANWIRFKIVEGNVAPTAVTVQLIYQEE